MMNCGDSRDATLKRYSEVILASSVNIVFATAAELYLNENARGPYIRCALMDSFRIHTRALLFFFYGNNPKPDDAKAQDFMRAGIEWSKVRRNQTVPLINLQQRVGKEVAHLTYSRPFYTDDAVDWDIGTEIRDLYLLLKEFISYSDASKLHTKVAEAPGRWLQEFRRFDANMATSATNTTV